MFVNLFKNKFLILISIFLFSACEDSNSQMDYSLVGNWRWIETSGGIAGIKITPSTASKTERLAFSDSTISIYQNDSLAGVFKYSIEIEQTIFSEEPISVLKIPSFSSPSKVIFLTEDTLRLSDNFVDGMTQTYVRLNY